MRSAVILFCFAVICNNLFAQKQTQWYVSLLQPALFAQSKVMMHDVVNPPAASRYYAYGMLAAYAIVSQHNPTLPPAQTFIKQYKPIVIYPSSHYDYRIAALYSILEAGKLMLPSGYMIEDDEQKMVKKLKEAHVSQVTIDESVAVAKDVTAQIILFSKSDHYNQLSAKRRYTPVKGEGYWYPTPPGYIEAVEPNWKTVRPMMIDSCNQFVPKVPVTFSKDSSSAFFALAKEVYNYGVHPTKEELTVASFWDCNPFAIETSGHMMIGFKKISPGGHWINIGSIAAQKAKLSFDDAVAMETYLAGTLMDAFISCWDEKYRSNRIRPETYIVRYIDQKWTPLLQTPPFPEYTSGHSVISTAAAEVLTYLLGDHFLFTDDSEEIFELPARTFSSFKQAANEAAVSRIYGGIHFRDSVEWGQEEGKKIGEFVTALLKKAGVKPMRGS
ncbi:MAG: vanadium-dependent haloperoxidase [Bacteroidota bacterium]|nr:vanadium-dependent haloperoxidase [Bacteroidota bacterium]